MKVFILIILCLLCVYAGNGGGSTGFWAAAGWATGILIYVLIIRRFL